MLAVYKKPLIGVIFSSCSSNLATNTGQNISFLLKKHDKNTIKELINDKNYLKKAKVNPIEENENWKLKLIEDIILLKKVHVELEFDENDLDEILDYVCTI